jgi:uncharacterized membrane protein YhaH (DUF805 family)
MDWYLMVWKRYAEFEGRSRRKEFWMFVLFNLLAILALAALGGAGMAMSEDYGGFLFIPLGIYVLAALIPNLAVSVRRFHDIDKSGWLLLLLIVLGMIPFVGVIASIVEIVLFCQDGNPGINQYGPNPKFPEQAVGVFAGNAGFTSMGLGAPPQPFAIASQPQPAPFVAPPQPVATASSLVFCRSCGTKLTDGSSFCTTCGTHV